MTEFDLAAILLGSDGAAGESGALANYAMMIGSFQRDILDAQRTTDQYASYNTRPILETIIDRTKERMADEFVHLLGNVADAIELTGLKIASDDFDRIMSVLQNAKATS